MTDQEWLESLDEKLVEEELERSRERRLMECRRQRVVTQEQLAEIVEEREQLEYDWAHKDEMFAQIMSQGEEQLAWDERTLKAALEGGAVVERGELTLEEALPAARQMRLPFGPQLVYRAVG